ncbi:MAG: bifunctional protein-serine/threonine kinase/phosphatase [Pseudomonadota bacterium]
MTKKLKISIGQSSDKGIKEQNEDSYGVLCPTGQALKNKGITAIIADGMGSCEHPKEASYNCVNSFISDYYSTPDSWTIRSSAARVLTALNSWLYGKGLNQYAKAYVSTFSCLILKSTTAHIFHIGDSRIYRYHNNDLEQLTADHRLWISNEKNYLNRAVGIDLHLEIDYKTIAIEKGDIFVMTSDGVHDYLTDKELSCLLQNNTCLDQTAQNIISSALKNNSNDNVTCQLIQIDELPEQEANEVFNQLLELPFPPELEAGIKIDGYLVLKELSASSTSQLYLVEDCSNGKKMVMKTPSINYIDEPAYLEQFHIEEWAGKRLNHDNLLITYEQSRLKNYQYILLEYIDGINLAQWIDQNPHPEINTVIEIIEQITKGIRAIHRMEMLHRDLKPNNIMISKTGAIKIIDFGSIKIAGVEEITSPVEHKDLMGTKEYTAPECLLGIKSNHKSDLFSLAVICYEMLTQKQPYGKQLNKHPQLKNINKLTYKSSLQYNPMIPLWIDGALKKAVHYDHRIRYESFSEFIYDLKHPNEKFLQQSLPLIQSNPLKTWQLISAALLISNLILIYFLAK